MKLAKIMLVVMLGLLGSLFYMMNSMTTRPGSISGNGNPALLFIVPLIFCFVILVILLRQIFIVHQVRPKLVNIGMLVAATYFVIGFVMQRIGLSRYRGVIYETNLKEHNQVDWHYVESITSFLSIHVNNQYFNVNTFFMFISITLLLAFYTYKQDIQVEVRK